MKSYFFVFILTIISASSFSQEAFNQYDEDGKRHGVWRKFFDKTKELRYEGQFYHGKEIDTFKFYTLSNDKSVLSGVKVFNKQNNIALVTFLSSKGKLISEGKMDGKLYVGKWLYYHNKNNAIMSVENYNDKGEMSGEKWVFYENGNTAQKSLYASGKLNGASVWYAENGAILKEFQYENGELNGGSKYYDSEGNIQSEGIYRNGLKHGVWNYYEGGKFVKSKDHTKRSKNPKKQ